MAVRVGCSLHLPGLTRGAHDHCGTLPSSQFTSFLDIVGATLAAEGLATGRLDGKTRPGLPSGLALRALACL